jgi:transcriptional regulator with XRE-family HTH domain
MPRQPNPQVRHSPAHESLGRAIRELRARFGLSQEELGFQSGLHRNYIGAIERGEINPTFRVLLKLERGLPVPLSEIIVLYELRLHQTSGTRRNATVGSHAALVARAGRRSRP